MQWERDYINRISDNLNSLIKSIHIFLVTNFNPLLPSVPYMAGLATTSISI